MKITLLFQTCNEAGMASKHASATALLSIVLLLLSSSTEANAGKNHHAKNQLQLINARPSLMHTLKRSCLSPIPFCNFLNSFQSLDVSRPTLIIKKQITAELHIPLPVPPCETKQSNIIKILEKVTRPKKWEWLKTDLNKKSRPKKWQKVVQKGKQRPKKWEILPGNDKNDFSQENEETESIEFKEISKPTEESKEEFKNIRGPQKEDFEPNNEEESNEELEVKEVNKPKKWKEIGGNFKTQRPKLTDFKPESQVKDEGSREDNNKNKLGSLPNIEKPNTTIFKGKNHTEHTHRPVKTEFKTKQIDLNSLEDTTADVVNKPSIDEKKTESVKVEGAKDKGENKADRVEEENHTEHINRPMKTEFKTKQIDLNSLEDTTAAVVNKPSIDKKKTDGVKVEGAKDKGENKADRVEEENHTEHINRPKKTEFKTKQIDLNSLEDTTAAVVNKPSINEKKTESVKVEGAKDKGENKADDGSSKLDCENKKNDGVENYDDYIVEEHEKCGCKGKDVLDYDVLDETEEPESKKTEKTTTQVQSSKCDEMLRKLLLVLAPSLSPKQLTKAAEIISPNGDRSFLNTLQAMAKDSYTKDDPPTIKPNAVQTTVKN